MSYCETQCEHDECLTCPLYYQAEGLYLEEEESDNDDC